VDGSCQTGSDGGRPSSGFRLDRKSFEVVGLQVRSGRIRGLPGREVSPAELGQPPIRDKRDGARSKELLDAGLFPTGDIGIG